MTDLTCQPFTWPTDADGWPLDLCTECGAPVSGASRHYRCRAARPGPVATQMQMLDHLESLKTDPAVLAKLHAAATGPRQA